MQASLADEVALFAVGLNELFYERAVKRKTSSSRLSPVVLTANPAQLSHRRCLAYRYGSVLSFLCGQQVQIV